MDTSNTECNNMSLSKQNMKKWLEYGNKIPICINDGCSNTVAIRHWSAQGDPSLKTECTRCSSARKKNKDIIGITFHKKKYCENKDGILGFVCPMDKLRYDEFPSDIYHMDHLDGNHHNNLLDNLKTFCAICHTRKGKESGDFNGFKSSSRIHKI
jgi:5-methylcytosine-specific restriction endonuclease McrA